MGDFHINFKMRPLLTGSRHLQRSISIHRSRACFPWRIGRIRMRASLPVGFVLCAAIAAAQTPLSTNSPIQNLATDFHGSTLYFTTSLRQRGTTQSAISKVFGLSAAGLQLIQQSSFNSIVPGAPIYGRPSVSGDGAVLAINWYGYCLGGSFCLFSEFERLAHPHTGWGNEHRGPRKCQPQRSLRVGVRHRPSRGSGWASAGGSWASEAARPDNREHGRDRAKRRR